MRSDETLELWCILVILCLTSDQRFIHRGNAVYNNCINRDFISWCDFQFVSYLNQLNTY